ncbi:MAG TPA: alkyl sulfatase dimerization domain-containing protein [Acidimicrobiales bacterium]|nr:alkyl sulfatase dimerization domain-containing protein [Acidimicrobiales bacterium]
MGDVLDLAERLWTGDADIADHHPFRLMDTTAEEVADGVAFVPSFANVSAVATDDGLVLVDTGSQFLAAGVHEALRGWTDQRLNTAVYSHGHIDHVFGVPVFEAEAADKGWPAPRVIAHEALPPRFDRYILTAGFNSIINQRQFKAPGLQWPTDYRYPDETYRDHLALDVGGVPVELHHARGETDDHTWTWFPTKKVLGCGDFFIWASPNAGNPQKVQRYPKEWAVALRKMTTMGAEVLLPGHGLPIVGNARITQALTDAADLLDHLHDETVAMMNAGARLDEIIHTVKPPAHLIEKPYLRPTYDEPEFVVRNVWRLYGGWYDGNPAHLKPAPDADLAAELAALAGGVELLARRALELADAGEFRLAGHLAELASQAAPDNRAVHAARATVFGKRADDELSTMSRGIFSWASEESHRHS